MFKELDNFTKDFDKDVDRCKQLIMSKADQKYKVLQAKHKDFWNEKDKKFMAWYED